MRVALRYVYLIVLLEKKQMDIHTLYVINSIGLLLDVSGFVMLYNSGSPSLREDDSNSKFFRLEGLPKKKTPELVKAKRGVYFIIYGFSIQFICSLYQAFF
jgi:hypothetical protein